MFIKLRITIFEKAMKFLQEADSLLLSRPAQARIILETAIELLKEADKERNI